MPGRSAAICSYPGCSSLYYDGSGRCSKHPRKVWAPYYQQGSRISGRTLQHARKRLFSKTPLCEWCSLAGKVELATVRDHIVPLAEGGLDAIDNVQALCEPCHAVKSQQEARRGRGLEVRPEEAVGRPGGRQQDGGDEQASPFVLL